MKRYQWILQILLWSLGLTHSYAEPNQQPQALTHESSFAGYDAPESLTLDSNPLEYAASVVGLDLATFSLPRGHEGSYRFYCRFPLIDAVGTNPLYLATWTATTARALGSSSQANGLVCGLTALDLLRGVETAHAATPAIPADYREAFMELLKPFNLQASYLSALVELCYGYSTALALLQQMRSSLSAEELAFLCQNPGYYLLPDGETMPELTGRNMTQPRFIETARKISYEKLFAGAAIIIKATEIYRQATAGMKAEDFFNPGAAKDFNTVVTLPGCDLFLSGTSDDSHTEDYPFSIDLGGNDLYTNNAGGCGYGAYRLSLAIDHAGHDRYHAPDSRYVQGFGFLGVGLLLDLAGNDQYEAQHFCQGVGILGVGLLADMDGDDTYFAKAFCQGAGMFGLGITLDAKGEDSYECSTLGQASATTLGLGVLLDSQGDDRYHLSIGPGVDALGSAPGYGQGGALSFRPYPWRKKLTAYGGVGLLIDQEGNDRYRSGGWCDQGGSYVMSLGALVDFNGNDHYSAVCGQGSGIHITNAILLDYSGHDIYDGGFRCGGSGGDRSSGFLLDYQGDDVYNAGKACYGTGCKPFSFSLFIDYAGRDTYVAEHPKAKITFDNWHSFGGVWPESESHLWPYAFCLDLQGADIYKVQQRANNSLRHSFGHGLHLDGEWSGEEVIREQRVLESSNSSARTGFPANPLPGYGNLTLPRRITRSPYGKDLNALLAPDTFTRFQAIGRIVAYGPAIIPSIVEALQSSTHRQLNRDLLECLHIFLVTTPLTAQQLSWLTPLLGAPDPEVRMIMADSLGLWECQEAIPELLKRFVVEPEPEVRRFMLGALYNCEAVEGLSLAEHALQNEPSPEVRRGAARYLARVRGQIDPVPVLLKALTEDADPSVRVAAATSLAELRTERALPAFELALLSPDIYLRRAAARGLAELDRLEGISQLIESLTFPSIDAFYNYDRNIPNLIADYAGFDLPEDQRYEQEAWRAWFQEHQSTIDLKRNKLAHRALQEVLATLADLDEQAQIDRLRNYHSQHPTNVRAPKLLAQLLNQSAWLAATKKPYPSTVELQRALDSALEAVDLHPIPDYIDTLIEVFLALDDQAEALRVCQEGLERFPNNSLLLERLATIRTLMGSTALQ